MYTIQTKKHTLLAVMSTLVFMCSAIASQATDQAIALLENIMYHLLIWHLQALLAPVIRTP